MRNTKYQKGTCYLLKFTTHKTQRKCVITWTEWSRDVQEQQYHES